MKLINSKSTILPLLLSGIFVGASHADEPDKYFVDVHDSLLGRILAAKYLDEFEIPIDPDFYLAAMTNYASLDEFEKRSERERYLNQADKFVQNDVEFFDRTKGFSQEGVLSIGEFNFAKGNFLVENASIRHYFSIDNGELKDGYRYPIALRSQMWHPRNFPGNHYTEIDKRFYYQFDWIPTELDLSFGSNDEAKNFLDTFGRYLKYLKVSTFREVIQRDDDVTFLFDVQCIILVGGVGVKIFPVRNRGTTLCEEYANVTVSQDGSGEVDFPENWDPEWAVDIYEAWDPKWNDVDTSIMAYEHQNWDTKTSD